jgi:hypothetical protein
MLSHIFLSSTIFIGLSGGADDVKSDGFPRGLEVFSDLKFSSD